MRLLLAAISFSILSALAGCVAMSPSPPVAGEGDSDSDSDKGYQFGDISKALLQRQRDYCIETSPVLRAVGLALIRSKVPGYPSSGLCTDAEKKLAEELAKQIDDLPEGNTVDIEQAIEQARKDQKRFLEEAEGAEESEESEENIK